MAYHNQRTPEQVARNNGKQWTFETISKHYESVKPIRGKKLHLNIRPMGERNRHWDRVVKVSDNEYYITCFGYQYHDSKEHIYNKAITFKQFDGIETVVVHTPRKTWGMNKEQSLNDMPLHPNHLSSSSTFYFYDYNLPQGLFFNRHNSDKYVGLQGEDGNYRYFTAEQGDTHFTRKVGDKFWLPLLVHRKFKHLLDRTKTKEIREKIKPLFDYLNVMVDLVERNWTHNNPVVSNTEFSFELDIDGNAPEDWMQVANYYKYRCVDSSYVRQGNYVITDHKATRLRPMLQRDAYRKFKPFLKVEIPLGSIGKDSYKSWVK